MLVRNYGQPGYDKVKHLVDKIPFGELLEEHQSAVHDEARGTDHINGSFATLSFTSDVDSGFPTTRKYAANNTRLESIMATITKMGDVIVGKDRPFHGNAEEFKNCVTNFAEQMVLDVSGDAEDVMSN